jgi:hypothetical protein
MPAYRFSSRLSRCLSPHVCSLRVLHTYTMSIRWIRSVLPKIMEQDAGSGYCYAKRESNLKHVRCAQLSHPRTGTPRRETGGTRPELNSSPASAFSEAAGVVSTARIERPLFHREGSASKKDTWPLPSILLSPRVARAQEINRLHPLRCPTNGQIVRRGLYW